MAAGDSGTASLGTRDAKSAADGPFSTTLAGAAAAAAACGLAGATDSRSTDSAGDNVPQLPSGSFKHKQPASPSSPRGLLVSGDGHAGGQLPVPRSAESLPAPAVPLSRPHDLPSWGSIGARASRAASGTGAQFASLPVRSIVSSAVSTLGLTATVVPDAVDGNGSTTSSAVLPAESLDAVITATTPMNQFVNMHMVLGRDVALVEGAVRGTGAFGTVVEGILLNGADPGGGTGAEPRVPRVAIKLLRGLAASVAACSAAEVESLRKEVEVLSRCRHANIVRLLGGCLTPPDVFLVEELCESSLDRVLRVGRDIALGLAYLHPTVVHRDLKPGNVLISSDGTAKLSDFGLARLTAATLHATNPEVGSVPYMAPECFGTNGHTVSHRSDMFAFGVLLWELLARVRPWAGSHHIKVALAVSIRGERLPLAVIQDRAPRRLVQLIEECWHEDPYRRPSALDAAKRLTVIMQELPPGQGQGQTQAQLLHPTPGPGSGAHTPLLNGSGTAKSGERALSRLASFAQPPPPGSATDAPAGLGRAPSATAALPAAAGRADEGARRMEVVRQASIRRQQLGWTRPQVWRGASGSMQLEVEQRPSASDETALTPAAAGSPVHAARGGC
ncbi:hypothetical protein GPECTOR_5g441 [Gonium pectorale]|uniref:Protein kinase domain-containing protein n=1 Tax=Gonium pectorale TaxID=33097 RepID=A0A150GWX7_GONPE|nr:hypothetical protein GPECTOR_5g441 [Gonium pectorale]|eukprot:KXZ54361.1 hypothetical protein GPECTOR_5g441 [Gonium pectorale]